MQDLDVLAYVQSKFPTANLKRTGQEVNVPCCFCGEDPGKRGRLYINVDPNMDPPGLFHCKLCDETGALNKLRKHFGDPVIRDDSERGGDRNDSRTKFTPRLQQILQFAAKFYHDKLMGNDAALDYLQDERGLTLETIEKFKLGWADGTLIPELEKREFKREEMIRSGLVTERGRDFLYNHIVIPYMTLGSTVVSLRGKEIGGKYLTPRGHKAHLFNSDVGRSETLLIAEGEFDAMSLEQLGFKAVAAPGAGTWQDSWTEYIESKRTYIIFDADQAGEAGADKLSSKLVGSRIVHIPQIKNDDGELADVSDLIVKHGKTKQDFDFWLVKSKGGILLTVDEAYAEWLEVEGNPNLQGLELGLEVVDTMIRPGLLPAQVMFVLAKTGVGKTISLLNIFHRITMQQPDKKILFVSLEQTRNEWFERARRIHRFYDLDATEQDTLEWYRHRFMMVDKNRVTEDELKNCIEQFDYDVGSPPDLVAVDYLGYWARSYGGESYERTSAAAHAMKAIAKEYRVPFIAPHQVSRLAEAGKEPSLNAARDSGVVEETADFIFALWSPDQTTGKSREERSGEIKLKVLKSRHGGVGTQVQLQFAPLSLALVPKGDEHFQRAVNDHSYALRGDTFDEAIRKHQLLQTQRAQMAREEF